MNEPRRRGRPVELDLERVAGVALQMFRERGYDEVTMEDIASAVGHSRRTIFRHFPTKAALVWAGTEQFIDVLRHEIAATDPSLAAIDAVRVAYVQATRLPPGTHESTRQRLLLIGENHTLHSDGILRFAGVGEAIREVFIEREGIDPHGLEAAIVGDAIVNVAHDAFVWWARHGEGEPGPVLDEAIRRLGSGFRQR